jgi:UDP-N-acetylglucosamine 2-epimerase
MAGIFFDELHIPKPDYDLGIGSASHGKQTGEMLKNRRSLFSGKARRCVSVW